MRRFGRLIGRRSNRGLVFVFACAALGFGVPTALGFFLVCLPARRFVGVPTALAFP
jgi:hypothetical protein